MDSTTALMLQVLMPLMISIVMFGLGLDLVPGDFYRVWKLPKTALVALVTKCVCMPLVAWGLWRLFGFSTAYSVGVILVAAGPCSIMASVFTKMAEANVALAVTLTAVDNLLSAINLPLWAYLAVRSFASDNSQSSFQFGESLKVFVMIVVPVIVGMACRARWPRQMVRIEGAIKKASLILIAALVLGVFFKMRELILAHIFQLGGAVLLLIFIGFAGSFLLLRVLRVKYSDAVASSMVMSIQSTTVVGSVVLAMFQDLMYTAPAAIYAFSIYPLSYLVARLFRRFKVTEAG